MLLTPARISGKYVDNREKSRTVTEDEVSLGSSSNSMWLGWLFLSFLSFLQLMLVL